MSKRYIVPADTALESFRSNGFKSTASALSEIIDNSVEAGATEVSVFLYEAEQTIDRRTVWKVAEIAVLDNGSGMSKDVLGTALQFGVGTRLNSTEDEGLGRFGMGLPNSSISQCKHVQVYSWQAPDKVFLAELDLDKIKRNNLQEFDEVTTGKLPKQKYFDSSKIAVPKSGTLVVWTKCDRLDAAKGETLINRVEEEIGRTYRVFVTRKRKPVKIQLIVLREGSSEPRKVHEVRANDPMYLTVPNTVTGFELEATNTIFGESKRSFKGRNGHQSEVKILYTLAKPNVQDEGGNSLVGRHYEKNTGVSFLRSMREIDFLDFGIETRSEARNRWWSCEVQFPPNLDDLFGVPNNKQGVHSVEYFASLDMKRIEAQIKCDGEDWQEYLADDQVLALNKWLSEDIRRNIDSMMTIIKGRKEGSKKGGGGALVNNIEAVLTEVAKKTGIKGLAKKEIEGLKVDQIKNDLESQLNAVDFDNPKDAVKSVQGNNLTLITEYKSWPGNQFMTLSRAGGVIVLQFNNQHSLIEAIRSAKTRNSFDEVSDIVELLLCTYAMAEDQALTEKGNKEEYEDIRECWGKLLKNGIKTWEGKK